ncbi:MAG: S-layer homology domain-containing protein [Clostridia bacterium]
MRKKITAMLLSVCMMSLPALSGLAAGSGFTQKAAAALNDLDRSMVIAALPLISSNRGLDMLETALDQYMRGEDPGLIMGPAIEIALQYTDVATMDRVLASLRLLSQDFRVTCQDIYQNVKGMELTSAEADGAALLLSMLYQKEPSLQTALEKHQITDGVLASLLAACVKENGSQAPLQFSGDTFTVAYYNAELAAGMNAIWQEADGGFDLVQTVENAAAGLNDRLSSEKKAAILPFLRRTGLLDANMPGGTTPGNGGGTPGGSDIPVTVKPLPAVQTASYQYLDTVDGLSPEQTDGGILLEVSAAGRLSLETEMNAPVVYSVSGAVLTPVKTALTIDGRLVAELSVGVYVIKETTPYFTDCDGWGRAYIEALYARQIINGKEPQLFRPEDTITREEFVKLVVELFDLTDPAAVTAFSDVPADAWYYKYVASAQQSGLISGISDSQFGVGASIRRQDMAKIISQVLKAKGITAAAAEPSVFSDFEAIADYARAHVLSIYNLQIISGDDNRCFNPNQFATRQEAAKMIYGMLNAVLTRG